MAILDELFVSLNLNYDGFIQGAKKSGEVLGKINESIDRSGKKIVDVGIKGADAFAGFRREAMGALALFTGGASIAKFTGDVAKANTSLGNLSRQLDIAPQKLTQFHEAMKAAGGNPGDIEALYTGVQNKFADPAGRGPLMNLSGYLGIDPVDQKTGHARADLIDQIAHSRVFRSGSRAVQDDWIRQLRGPASLNNYITRPDYDSLNKKFANLGPTPEQIRQGEQLLADWTALKANTDKVMQGFFSDMEPTLHCFLQSLIAIEKTNPKAIADGLAGLASALTAISLILTGKSFIPALKKIAGIGRLGVASTAGRMVAAASSATLVGGAALAGEAATHTNLFHGIMRREIQGENYVDQHVHLGRGVHDFLQRDIKRRESLLEKDAGLYGYIKLSFQEWGGILATAARKLVPSAAGATLDTTRGNTELSLDDILRHYKNTSGPSPATSGAVPVQHRGLPVDTAQIADHVTNHVETSLNELFRHYRERTGDWTGLGFEVGREQQIAQLERTYGSGVQMPPQTPFSDMHIANNMPVLSTTDGTYQNLDMNRLLGAVAMQESGGNPNAYNARTEASGEFQFMRATAEEQGLKNPFDAQQSWLAANRYLTSLINRFHSVDKGLAAYNWGQGHLAKDIRQNGDNWRAYLPRETSDYIDRINRNYETGHVVQNTSNTTNNVTVAINGKNKNARELATEISHALPQQTTGHVSTRLN